MILTASLYKLKTLLNLRKNSENSIVEYVKWLVSVLIKELNNEWNS